MKIKNLKLKIIFILIVALAVFLRFYHMRELSTFLADQAIESQTSADILKGDFALIGIKTSISELRNGAVMYYFLAPFLYLLDYDPIAGGVLQTILQIATVIIICIFFLKRKTLDIGLITSFLIATSPLLVKFSRQTMLAFYPLFFTTVSFLLSLTLIQNYKKRYSFVLGILLGFMIQIHYSTLAVIIYALIFPFFLLKKKVYIRYYATILSGALVGFSPMILFEVRNKFFQTHTFINFILSKSEHATALSINLISFWQESIAQYIFGGHMMIAEAFIVVLTTILVVYRKKLSAVEKACILQIAATAIFTALFVRQNVPHYIITAVVPLFILASSLGVKIWNDLNKNIIRNILLMLFPILFLTNYSRYGFTDNHGWTMTNGWTLDGTKKTAQYIYEDVQKTNSKNYYNIIMVVDAQNQAVPLRFFLNSWGNPPLPPESYDKAKILYVLTKPNINLKKLKIWELNSFGAYKKAKTWDIQNGFLLYKLTKEINE